MIITDDNISFDISIIEECMKEMSDSKISDKKKFFDSLVVDRLNKCNNLYIEEYNKGIDKLMKYIEIDAVSLKDIPKYMKKINKNLRSLYNVEKAIYNIL